MSKLIFSRNLPAKSYYVPSKSLKSAVVKTKVHSSAKSRSLWNSINVLLLFFMNEHYCSSFPSISFLLYFMYNNAIGIIPHQLVQIQEHLCHQLTLGSSGTSWLQACHSRKTPYAYVNYFLTTQLSRAYHIQRCKSWGLKTTF